MFHTIILTGNLTRDPELRYTQSGQAVANLSLAINDNYTKDGQTVERTMWVRVSAWGRTAENAAKFLTKGRQILVEGRLEFETSGPNEGNPRTFTRKDGSIGSAFEVHAKDIKYLSGGREAAAADAVEEEDVQVTWAS